jgi:hypothetical protein
MLILQSRGGMAGIQWPDGRALLHQPLRLVQAFNLVIGLYDKMAKKTT